MKLLLLIAASMSSAHLKILVLKEEIISTEVHNTGCIKLEYENATWLCWAPHASESTCLEGSDYPGYTGKLDWCYRVEAKSSISRMEGT